MIHHYLHPQHLEGMRIWWQHYGQHSHAIHNSWLAHRLGFGTVGPHTGHPVLQHVREHGRHLMGNWHAMRHWRG